MIRCRNHISGRNHLSVRQLVSIVLALAVTVSLAPGAFGKAVAGRTEKTKKYLVNDDGSETFLSDGEYERLKEAGQLQAEPEDADNEMAAFGSDALNTLKPTYNGVFVVYSTYFNYYPYNTAWENTKDDLYMEYSSNGGKKWTRTGYMRFSMIRLATDQGYKISSLKPDTTYRTRIRYGTDGPVRNTTTIRTGKAKKPEVKSIKAKAVKVKYHKVKHYGAYTGVYLYTEKFYTYKVKVTVKLKKKPGTAGVLLSFSNGLWSKTVWIKGNKKTYTKTFAPYPNYSAKNPRHRLKVAVGIQSCHSKKWGGVSPMYKKTKKLS